MKMRSAEVFSKWIRPTFSGLACEPCIRDTGALRWSAARRVFVTSAMLALLSACAGPDKVALELRKKNQTLSDQIEQLNNQHKGDEESIAALEAHATTVPVLPKSRLNDLFTAVDLKFGRLTGGYKSDPNAAADEMVKVYVVPTDEQESAIKAAGSFHIELFDLALLTGNRIGQWDFSIEQTRARFFDSAILYTYVLDCPWQKPPAHSKLTLRVTFTDALTQRVITRDQEISVELKPAK
jgi:hypothetical protein